MSCMDDEIDNDLPNIKGMTPKTMKLLADEGITSTRQLAMASVDDISKIQGVSGNKARQFIHARYHDEIVERYFNFPRSLPGT